MVYVKKITVEKYSDFLEMAKNQKFTISQQIVEAVLNNIDTRKKQLPVLKLKLKEKEQIIPFPFKEMNSFIH